MDYLVRRKKAEFEEMNADELVNVATQLYKENCDLEVQKKVTVKLIESDIIHYRSLIDSFEDNFVRDNSFIGGLLEGYRDVVRSLTMLINTIKNDADNE